MSRLLILLLAGTLALPASAGLFDDTEARTRIEKLRGELEGVAQRVDLATKNQVDFANQLEIIKSDIARLRGQLEVLTNDLDTTQKRQKDFYVDLDNRLRQIEGQAQEKAEAAKPVDPAAETRDYEAALTAFRSSKYSDAAAGFASFIATYPDSSLLANAHFWAGFSYAKSRNPGKAATFYGQFVALAPTDPRAPDALLEQADALQASGSATEARKVLQSIVRTYPGTDAAKKAKARLGGKR